MKPENLDKAAQKIRELTHYREAIAGMAALITGGPRWMEIKIADVAVTLRPDTATAGAILEILLPSVMIAKKELEIEIEAL